MPLGARIFLAYFPVVGLCGWFVRSTVMDVAAPSVDGERILGVVSVAKPNRTLQAYVERPPSTTRWISPRLVG